MAHAPAWLERMHRRAGPGWVVCQVGRFTALVASLSLQLIGYLVGGWRSTSWWPSTFPIQRWPHAFPAGQVRAEGGLALRSSRLQIQRRQRAFSLHARNDLGQRSLNRLLHGLRAALPDAGSDPRQLVEERW